MVCRPYRPPVRSSSCNRVGDRHRPVDRGQASQVIRAAKESLNGIDLWDVRRSYRYEQGFTVELNLSGVADEVRNQ